jgi:ribosomal protein S27AE
MAAKKAQADWRKRVKENNPLPFCSICGESKLITEKTQLRKICGKCWSKQTAYERVKKRRTSSS